MAGITNQIHVKHLFANTNALMQSMVIGITDQNKAPFIYNRQSRSFFEFVVSGGAFVIDNISVFATGDGGNTRRRILGTTTQPQDVFVSNLVSNTNIAGTYNNGTAGVGATMTGLAPAQITIDGVIASPGDVVLLTGQTAQLQNGPYVINTNVPFSPYVMTRIPEFDSTAELDSAYFYITDGVALSGTSRIQTTPDPIVGTNPIVFDQTSAVTTPTAPIEINVLGTTATVNRATANTYILNLTASTGNIAVTMTGGVSGNEYTLYVIDHATPRTLTFPVGTMGIETESNTYVADLPSTRYILPFSYLATPLWGTRYQFSAIPNVG